MGVLKEFKEFISKGNVIDLAVGVIIGGAFGKIVDSFVSDILMPPLSLFMGDNFKDLKFTLMEATNSKEAITINYGNFIQKSIDFLIIIFALFLIIKGVNKLKRNMEKEKSAKDIAPKEIDVLKDILTELKKK